MQAEYIYDAVVGNPIGIITFTDGAASLHAMSIPSCAATTFSSREEAVNWFEANEKQRVSEGAWL